MSSEIREKLEDLVCMNCTIANVCSDNMWHCEAFNRLLKICETYEAIWRLLGE